MAEAEFNVLHVCKSHNMLYHLSDYPVHAFNWAASEPKNPEISDFRETYPGKVVLGGINRASLNLSSPVKALSEARETWRVTGGRSWLAGPDCSVPPTAPASNIHAVVDLLRSGVDR